ncbi:MAG: hypothetical protein FWD69_09330 [Polyangiaceae bacterium]|nr:hypothetical protein [Polyangiaceae bacterium]
MGTGHRLAIVVLVSGLVALGPLSCKRKGEELQTATNTPSALPADRLAPGELPEGKEKAFELKLPQGMTISRAFTGTVHASSNTLAPEQVSNFFRARVTGGTVSVSTDEIRFLNVRAVADPNRELAIEIRRGKPGIATCEVLVRDITPPPFVPGLSEDERRNKAGLSPDGGLLDPKRME